MIVNNKCGGNYLKYISIVPYNRELLVIDDMGVFTNFFCYAKRQKKGLVPNIRRLPTADSPRNNKDLYEHVEESEDEIL